MVHFFCQIRAIFKITWNKFKIISNTVAYIYPFLVIINNSNTCAQILQIYLYVILIFKYKFKLISNTRHIYSTEVRNLISLFNRKCCMKNSAETMARFLASAFISCRFQIQKENFSIARFPMDTFGLPKLGFRNLNLFKKRSVISLNCIYFYNQIQF